MKPSLRKLLVVLAIILATTIFIASIQNREALVIASPISSSSSVKPSEPDQKPVTNPPMFNYGGLELADDYGLLTQLDQYEESFMMSDYTNEDRSVFNSTWAPGNLIFSDDSVLSIAITEAPENAEAPWLSGEYQTRDTYSYGLYEVSMKPIKNVGVVSAFFVYSDDGNIRNEIDVEFQGNNTEIVQFNYFVGNENHPATHTLGFDAADDFHVYAFAWLPDQIIWYIDGIEACRMPTNGRISTPSHILVNSWVGADRLHGWLGLFDGTTPLSAEYDWIRFTPITPIEI